MCHLLANEDSVCALGNIIFTKKYIAFVVLFSLYRDPYWSAFHQAGRGRRNREKPNSDEMLTRMLLSCLPVANLTKRSHLPFNWTLPTLQQQEQQPVPPSTISPTSGTSI